MSTAAAPIGATAVRTTAIAPTAGKLSRYNASGGALAVTLPALSGLNVGAVFGIQKDALDTSTNTVTVSTAGSDALDDGVTSLTLRLAGSQRTLTVVQVGSSKLWKVTGGHDPLTSLDGRFSPLGDLISLGLDRLELASGAPTKSSMGNQYGWNLHNTLVEAVGCGGLQIPPHWQTYAVDIEWCNITASTSGNVFFRYGSHQLADGSKYNDAMTYTGPDTVVAAPTVQFQKKTTRLANNVTVDPTKRLFARIIRLGNDALDTLDTTPGANATASVGIGALILTRDS